MALFDNILSGGNWVTGLAIGVGAEVVLPLATPILRPVAKTAIKSRILAYQGAAGLVESIGDLVAEAVAEAGQETPPASEAAPHHTGRAQPHRGGIRTEAKPRQRKPRSTRPAGVSRAGDRL
jgi:hypothetical protein